MPTEAGWEYVAQKTHPAGEKLPNQFGLVDMHGNVREWVEDCWHDHYQVAPKDGSAWVVGCSKEKSRVLRGGSWNVTPVILRSAYRIRSAPDYRSGLAGFRVARTPP